MPWYADLLHRVAGRQAAPAAAPPPATDAHLLGLNAPQGVADALVKSSVPAARVRDTAPAPVPEPPQTLRKRRLEARADLTALSLPIDLDVVAARRVNRWQRPVAYAELYARYTALLQAHPHGDVLRAKRALLAVRLAEEKEEAAELEAFAERVPSLLRRATLWLGLFVDRALPDEGTHALLGTSLATLRQLSAFDTLLPTEQEALLRQTSRHGGDLVARAIAGGCVADAATALDMAEACWDRVQATGSDWLASAVAHGADPVCVELLRAGVQVSEAQRAPLVRLGIEGTRAELLAELLSRPALLTAHELVDDGEGPYTLAQGAAAATSAVAAKLQVVASAGGLAVARPKASPLPSVLHSALSCGDAGVRTLLRLPFVWDAAEPDGSPAPLAQLVAGDYGAALHLVLQCGLGPAFRDAHGATLAELAEAYGALACRRVLDMHALRARSQPNLLRGLSLPALTAHQEGTPRWTTRQLAAFDGLYALTVGGVPHGPDAVDGRDAVMKELHNVWPTADGRDAAWQQALGEALGQLENAAQVTSVLRGLRAGLAWYDTQTLRQLPGHASPFRANNDLLLLAAHRTRSFGEATFAAACEASTALHPAGIARASLQTLTSALHVAAKKGVLDHAAVARLRHGCGSREVGPQERLRRALAVLRDEGEAPWYSPAHAGQNLRGALSEGSFAAGYAWGGGGGFGGGFSRRGRPATDGRASLSANASVPVPRALRHALDAWAQEPCVQGPEAAAASMPALLAAHGALTDEEVQDALAEPGVADATLALLGCVLGTQLTYDVLLAADTAGTRPAAQAHAEGAPTAPTATLALKKRLAAWHTDRGHADATRAEATTRLLILAKAYLTVAPKADALRLAAARAASARAR